MDGDEAGLGAEICGVHLEGPFLSEEYAGEMNKNYLRSQKNADIVLLSVKSESPVDGGSLVTKIGQLYIVDVLCTGLMRKNGDRYRDNVDRANKSVIKKLI